VTAKRLYFTVTAGRSGQASLTGFLQTSVPQSLALFEAPQVRPVLPRFLGDIERRLRRRYFETHELLGRGAVLTAFEQGDEAALDRFAARRLAWIDGQVKRSGAEICIDVSKYFARGMHRAIARARPDIGIIRLVRDPILNMRSFLGRNKNFYLDNVSPSCEFNLLRLDADSLSLGELYLWAWCEMYLRFDRLVEEFSLSPAVEIRTEDLNDPSALAEKFSTLDLSFGTIEAAPPRNTNVSQGHGETIVRMNDIETFERFRDRLPADIEKRISYFNDYDARTRFAVASAA
jgi:hypothetical protein